VAPIHTHNAQQIRPLMKTELTALLWVCRLMLSNCNYDAQMNMFELVGTYDLVDL